MGDPNYNTAKRLGLQSDALDAYTSGGGRSTIFPLLLQPFDEPLLDKVTQTRLLPGDDALANLQRVPLGADLVLYLPVLAGFDYQVIPYYRIRTISNSNAAGSGQRGFSYRLPTVKVVDGPPFVFNGLNLAPAFTALDQLQTLDDSTLTLNSLITASVATTLYRGLGVDNNTAGSTRGPYVGLQFKALGDEVGFLIYPTGQDITGGSAVRNWGDDAADQQLIELLGGSATYGPRAASGAWLLAGANAN